METRPPTRTTCTLAALVLVAVALVGHESTARTEPDVRTNPDRADEATSQLAGSSLDQMSVETAETARQRDTRSREPYTVAVVSDMNGSYGSTDYAEPVHRTVEWLTGGLQPDLVVSTGDHVAGQKQGLDYAAMWEAFHDAVTRPLQRAGIPFAPSPGNHDASPVEQFEQERRQYEREWRPNRPDVEFVGGGDFPFHYAFRAGPALFVALDATMPGRLPDEQFDWLASVLRNHDAETTVVYGHLPLAPFAEGKRDEALESERLERLLDETGVDVMLSGHHHAYYPGRRGDLRLVGLSCLGAGPRPLIGTDRRARRSAVVMQIHPDGQIEVDARTGERMQKHIDREELPRTVGTGRWKVWRDDLGGLNTNPLMQSLYGLRRMRSTEH
jgi:hypothetical protein